MAIIDKPTDYFNTVLYTGNDTDNRTVSGVGFQPNFLWIKARNNADQHYLVDSVRGSTKVLHSDSTEAEATRVSAVKSFASDGFVLGQEAQVNRNGGTFVGWNWKEEATLFDIVSFTGNGNARTISHNLGSVPKFMIIKDRDNVRNWGTYHVAIGPSKDAGYLNNTVVPEANNNFWNNTTPTASVFSVGTDGTYNGNGNNYIVYLFGNSSVTKCSSYIGNGSSDGTFVHTGFKPAFVLVKRTDSANDWCLYDNKRDTYNVVQDKLQPNQSSAESDDTSMDFVSNGFKFRETGGNFNASGGSYIYMAFAENPFVTSTGNGSIPACAR